MSGHGHVSSAAESIDPPRCISAPVDRASAVTAGQQQQQQQHLSADWTGCWRSPSLQSPARVRQQLARCMHPGGLLIRRVAIV